MDLCADILTRIRCGSFSVESAWKSINGFSVEILACIELFNTTKSQSNMWAPRGFSPVSRNFWHAGLWQLFNFNAC